MAHAEFVAKPCRNFCILSAEAFRDPLDGREKVAMVSFANHTQGLLILLDPRADSAEAHPLPLDNGAWALYNHRNEALIIGTCAEYGCVHRFDLRTRRFDEPLRTETETYIWNFADGGDGWLYGGTYGGCRLVRYHLEERRLEDLGRVSPDSGDLYARRVYAVPGHILIDTQMATNRHWAYRLADGAFLPADSPGVPPLPEEAGVQDARLQKGMSHALHFADGSLFALEGQEYRFFEGGGAQSEPRRIPCEAPATGIMELAAAPDGRVYGSTNFGMTIFRYNPADGSYWNSLGVAAYGGGEVYGLVFAGERLYMTSYANGFHLEYDPRLPWNHRENQNPRILREISPDGYIRPHSHSVLGPGGMVWTGWMAKYGVYGGALSRISPADGEVALYPAGNQGIGSIAADEEAVYYVTCGAGNGLADAPGPFALCAVDAERRETARRALPEDLRPGHLAVCGGEVLLSAPDAIHRFEAVTLRPLGAIPVPGCTKLLPYDGGLLAFTGDGRLLRLSPGDWAVRAVCDTPKGVRAACVAGNTVWFSASTELWRVTGEI